MPPRTRLGPPGVDVERFAPGARWTWAALRARLAAVGADAATGSSFERDPRRGGGGAGRVEPGTG